jgi:hypothetical protein
MRRQPAEQQSPAAGQGQQAAAGSCSASSSGGDLGLPFGMEDVISFGADDVERIDQFVALLKQGEGGGGGGGSGGEGGGEQPPREWARQKLWTILMINLVRALPSSSGGRDGGADPPTCVPSGTDDTVVYRHAPLPPQPAHPTTHRIPSPTTHRHRPVAQVSIMEKMDEQILPAVSRFIGCSFRARPHQLGNITFGRALVQALASPLGGIAGGRPRCPAAGRRRRPLSRRWLPLITIPRPCLVLQQAAACRRVQSPLADCVLAGSPPLPPPAGHYYNRVNVLLAGCTIWGFFTLCFSLTTTVHQVCSRALYPPAWAGCAAGRVSAWPASLASGLSARHPDQQKCLQLPPRRAC